MLYLVNMKFVLLIVLAATSVSCRIASRGEVANALRRYGVPGNQMNTWFCIVQRESHYDTQAHNTQSGDHGIFQINQVFWCSPPGTGCGMTCDSLRDDNIDNDAKCAKHVFDETQKNTGNGFTAWVTYNDYCRFHS